MVHPESWVNSFFIKPCSCRSLLAVQLNHEIFLANSQCQAAPWAHHFEFSRYPGELGDVSDLCIAMYQYCTLEVAGIHLDPAADVIVGDELWVCAILSFLLHVKVYFEQINEAFLEKVGQQYSCDYVDSHIT